MKPYQSKLSILRGFMAAKDYPGALQLAKSWHDLGEERDAITRGWEACKRPEFYRGLGQDPAAHVAAGIAALHRRYDR